MEEKDTISYEIKDKLQFVRKINENCNDFYFTRKKNKL